MFDDKPDLLGKIKYYLKNEKRREEVADNMYNKIINEYNLDKELRTFFNKINSDKEFTYRGLPKSDKGIVALSIKDLMLEIKDILKLIGDNDYVTFEDPISIVSKYKNSFQIYSLEKSGRNISCCDYYLSSNRIGDYFGSHAKYALYSIPKEDFYGLLDWTQLMVTKDYFLQNIGIFKRALKNKKIDFVDEANTIFVSIPLIRIYRSKKIKYSTIKKLIFNLKVPANLVHLIEQRRLFTSMYIYRLIFCSINPKKFFILRYLIETLFNKKKIKTLKNVYHKEL